MAFNNYTAAQKEDLAVALSVLALHDAQVDISADNINALAAAAGVTLAPYWGSLYASVFADKNVDDLLMKPGAGGAVAAAAGAPAAGGAAAPAAEEKKEESESEEEAGGAGGLFGGDEDDW